MRYSDVVEEKRKKRELIRQHNMKLDSSRWPEQSREEKQDFAKRNGDLRYVPKKGEQMFLKNGEPVELLLIDESDVYIRHRNETKKHHYHF